MDFSKNSVLKENYSFFVGDTNGFITGNEHGLYNRDTRFLSHYKWAFPVNTQTLLNYSPRPDTLELHHSELDNHQQLMAFKRTLTIKDKSFLDTLVIENPFNNSKNLKLDLTLTTDFADLFEARGWHQTTRDIQQTINTHNITFSYDTQDKSHIAASINTSEQFQFNDGTLSFQLELPARGSCVLTVEVAFVNPFETGAVNKVPYEAWREQFREVLTPGEHHDVLSRAVDDLRALLLFDEAGTLPAAGIPWFVAPFGRDALITSILMMPYGLEAARGTVQYLAKHQATKFDAFRNAQPGKILHEVRCGELSRMGRVPHSTYYGTVDATPLFIILIHEIFKHQQDIHFIRDLRPHWEAALTWMRQHGDIDQDGLLEFEPDKGEGLSIQSWKDSSDSMSHQDGSLATGALAVSEVQGYAYAAYLSVADFYAALNEPEKSQEALLKAQALQQQFHKAFWLEDAQMYAMALDGNKQSLNVQNSDSGQLLWTGIVPQDIAPKLIKSLMSSGMYSGWGIRTLGKNEARYNPVSYHNGSVWPHDTALIALGMARYGFRVEAQKIAHAIFALAKSQADKRLPELVAGYERMDSPPVPYPTACRPQAWDAAALISLQSLLADT